jgi:hypothetical protein
MENNFLQTLAFNLTFDLQVLRLVIKSFSARFALKSASMPLFLVFYHFYGTFKAFKVSGQHFFLSQSINIGAPNLFVVRKACSEYTTYQTISISRSQRESLLKRS